MMGGQNIFTHYIGMLAAYTLQELMKNLKKIKNLVALRSLQISIQLLQQDTLEWQVKFVGKVLEDPS